MTLAEVVADLLDSAAPQHCTPTCQENSVDVPKVDWSGDTLCRGRDTATERRRHDVEDLYAKDLE